jgi:alternate signal-mediated exported protein
MNNTLKGTIAASAAAALLLGGAGTLAYWSDSEDVVGGAIDSGELSLTQESGQTCSSWTLDSAGGDTAYTPGSTLVVPGDVISRTCTYTVNAGGKHLAADLGLEAVSFSTSNDLVTALDAAVSYTLGGVAAASGDDITSADDLKVLVAKVSVTFDTTTSGTTAQNLTTSLNDLTVSLTQTHA